METSTPCTIRDTLVRAAKRIQSPTNRAFATRVIEQAALNAVHTIQDEHMDASSYESLFRGSVGVLICDAGVDKHVVAFFVKHGITY